VLVSGIRRFVAAQAAVGCVDGVPDRRSPADDVAALLDRLCDELTPEEDRGTRKLLATWPDLDDCGLPATAVHGDFHPRKPARTGQPLGHLMYAVRHQEFLDGIEPSEQLYHLGDPAAVIRQAPAWQTGTNRFR
jgi:hypothetical protein